MRSLLSAILVLALLAAGCGAAGRSSGGRPAGKGDVDKVRIAMTSLFSALEMYAGDHSLTYPENPQDLVPKYLDAMPKDPVSGETLVYKKTEDGYLISTDADYSSAGAAEGFPQMDQDGFFALKPADFPSPVDEGSP